MTREKMLALSERVLDKWDKICFEGGKDTGSSNCAYCQFFYNDFSCGFCPIYVVSRVYSCRQTPYDDWLRGPSLGQRVIYKGDLENAIEEYLFLCAIHWELVYNFEGYLEAINEKES